jgi:hypothetical protein
VLWDERVVKAIVMAAWDDFGAERWGRDFADKLRQRGITKEMVRQAIGNADAIVLYRYRGLRSVGFWHPRWRLIVVWSPRHPSRWVTAFQKPPDGKSYLMGQDDAELLWERR